MRLPDRTVAPVIRPIEHFELPVPEERILPGGIPLRVLRMGDEDVVRFDVLMRGGQWNQELPLQAMFTNRMLREGTRRFSSFQIAERLDYYGAWLDLSSAVNYGFVTLYSLVRHFPKTVEILSSMLREAIFPEKELDVVRNANRQQFLINAERVDVMARRQLNQALFGDGHPQGHPVVTDDYDRLSGEVLARFYHQHYHAGNCSLYLSGKVTPEILHCIEQHFGGEGWGGTKPSTSLPMYVPTPACGQSFFVEKADALQSSVKMGCFVPAQTHPDFQKLKVLVTVLGGYFGSRLMSNIREDKGYTYGIGAGLVPYPGSCVLGISTEAANEHVRPLIAEVYKEMERLAEQPVPQDELEMVKNYMLGDLCRSYEHVFSVPEAWIFMETAGLPTDFFEQCAQVVRSVDATELRDLACRYFRKENWVEVVAGK